MTESAMSGIEARVAALVRGRRAAVVGVGNRLRGDDAAGSVVAERLRGRVAAPVFDAETVPENYLGSLLSESCAVVIFVDAADHGGAPGECCLAPAAELAERAGSTHSMSLVLLSRALAAHGVECWLAGIQPGRAELGAELSPAAAAGVRALEDALAAALGAAGAAAEALRA